MTQSNNDSITTNSAMATAPVLPSLPPLAGVQYLLISLAGQEYGVRMETLQEVRRFSAEAVAPVPNTPHWLEGVFSLRGSIISVVNLRAFFGHERYAATPGTGLTFDQGFRLGGPIPRLLIVYSGELRISLLVDDILGVLFVNPAEIKTIEANPDDLAGPFLEGNYTDASSAKTVTLLDARKLIISPQILIFEQPE